MIEKHVDEDRKAMADLAGVGIDMQSVTDKLRVDGVASFTDSFDQILADLSRKQAELRVAG